MASSTLGKLAMFKARPINRQAVSVLGPAKKKKSKKRKVLEPGLKPTPLKQPGAKTRVPGGAIAAKAKKAARKKRSPADL